MVIIKTLIRIGSMDKLCIFALMFRSTVKESFII
jgi:hypothetical protein